MHRQFWSHFSLIVIYYVSSSPSHSSHTLELLQHAWRSSPSSSLCRRFSVENALNKHKICVHIQAKHHVPLNPPCKILLINSCIQIVEWAFFLSRFNHRVLKGMEKQQAFSNCRRVRETEIEICVSRRLHFILYRSSRVFFSLFFFIYFIVIILINVALAM